MGRVEEEPGIVSESEPEEAGRVPVLIVDDDPNARLVMREVLESEDRDLIFADSGEEALQILRRLSPAAILLDVHMSGMSGFETARLIRGRARLAGTPIVFMTGVSTDELSIELGYQLGAVDYLLKPIIPQVLESKVAAFCTLAQQRRELERQRDRLAVAEAKLLEANAELARLATTDALTGLGNRAKFDETLPLTHERAVRERAGYAIMLIDLDGFKQVNDTQGHAAGDRILAEAARRIRSLLRPYDGAYRIGGDEFCVIVPDLSDLADAVSLGERTNEELRRGHAIDPGVVADVPGSIGVALFDPRHPEPYASVLARADAAMYRAKADRCGFRVDRDPRQAALAGGGSEKTA